MSPDAGTRVAVVTGSRGGIGREVVTALTRDGFTVVGLDRSRTGVGAHEWVCDVVEPGDCAAAATRVEAEFGRVDAVVHCAGINDWQPFAELDLDRAHALVDVNVWGTVHVLRALGGVLRRTGDASVVVLTSTAGERGIGGTAAYGMSKAAVASLVRTLAVEWADVPVRVNAVSATIVPTAMNAAVRETPGYLEAKLRTIPLGRMVSAVEVAEAAAFLAGSASSGSTGETIHVDGGVAARG